MRAFGYDDRDHRGHAELIFNDVRVPASNLIAGEGEGFAIAKHAWDPDALARYELRQPQGK